MFVLMEGSLGVYMKEENPTMSVSHGKYVL